MCLCSALAWALVSTGCDPGASGRVRTAFDVEITGAGNPGQLVTNAGASVALRRAELSLGALAWFEGDALFALLKPRGIVDGLLSFSSAHAHPGHYTAGAALADMPDVGIVDLLAAPVIVAAEGLTGPYGSVSLPLLTGLEGGHTLRLEGDFVVGDAAARPFVAALPLAQTVEGVGCDVTVGDGGVMSVAVQLDELVRRIDFAAAAAADDGAVIDLSVIPQAHNALERALSSQNTFTASYTVGE
jgi:hypothetical protein